MDKKQIVDDAIISRRSVRAFLPTPVTDEEVRDMLHAAARAPSGTNMQPWKVHVLTGEAKEALSAAVLKAHDDPNYNGKRAYKYYPDVFPEPYLGRRRKVGWDLYNILEIGREDKDKMHAQLGRNYTFFDAPVGLMFTLDSRLEMGSWLDYGMFMENIMIAARGRGLHTCPQAAFANFQDVIKSQLNIPDIETVICGMAIGYEDTDAVENSLVTERAALEDFATFHN
jgi:nitroreductase